MPLLTPANKRFLTTLAELSYCNPFHPRRIELEQAALGKEFEPEPHVAWSRTAAVAHTERPNVARLTEKADNLAESLRAAIANGESASEPECQLYEDLINYVLYYRWVAPLSPAGLSGKRGSIANVWRSFLADFERFFIQPAAKPLTQASPDHLFACLHQLRRAFRHIFDCIYGDSLPAAQLRGTVWQSIFTHDMRRYRRTLYDRMGDLTTLITGPSGTGKELVARAIALSQYVPFDRDRECFTGKPDEGFIPINLSALSPTLIESELFGHRRGAFTGATSDRVGWLETCPPHGAVFLDEIGELDLAIQVKLLRVVQSREYSRLGDTASQPFAGKIIAATNRDLAEEMHTGEFRQDLYYRLCSDHIVTPSLKEQIADRSEALTSLVQVITQRIVRDASGHDAHELAKEVESWIRTKMDKSYPWPGNIRELEQCVRNILVRREYLPSQTPNSTTSPMPSWLAGVEEGNLTADELICRYCVAIYAKLGSYEQTAKALGLDRRTVRSKIEALNPKGSKQG